MKQYKTRVTVGLTAGMHEDAKYPLMIIGHSKNPRCFRGFRVNNHCRYYSSKRGWITAEIFADYVHHLNEQCVDSGMRHLMLVDNAAAHAMPQGATAYEEMYGEVKVKGFLLSRMHVIYLPPNTTSILQPLDMGVIYSWKCAVRTKMLTWLLEDALLQPRRAT